MWDIVVWGRFENIRSYASSLMAVYEQGLTVIWMEKNIVLVSLIYHIHGCYENYNLPKMNILTLPRFIQQFSGSLYIGVEQTRTALRRSRPPKQA